LEHYQDHTDKRENQGVDASGVAPFAPPSVSLAPTTDTNWTCAISRLA